MSESKEALDLSYRPASYFWPITHETHAIAAVQPALIGPVLKLV